MEPSGFEPLTFSTPPTGAIEIASDLLAQVTASVALLGLHPAQQEGVKEPGHRAAIYWQSHAAAACVRPPV
jgi:hypothetical protein